MRQMINRRQPQKSSASLKGMKGSKHLVEHVLVLRLGLQYQHPRFNLLEQVTAFVAKLIHQFKIIRILNNDGGLFLLIGFHEYGLRG